MSQFDDLFRHTTKSIKLQGMDETEETLLIKRASGYGYTIAITLSELWIMAEDGEEAVAKLQRYCNAMWGEGNWSRGELMHLSSFIESRLDDLLKTAPEHIPTKNEFENAMERMGVKVVKDGETMIDATGGKKKEIFLGRPSSTKVH